ncbi:hypothetical protein ABBQ38_012960 [Trebouxia sp. C0009 RCD-2024]
MQACYPRAPGCKVSSPQRLCCIPPWIYTQRTEPGHAAECVLVCGHPRSRPVLNWSQDNSHYRRHLQIHATSRSNLNSASGDDPSIRSTVTTLALLELLLSQPTPIAHTSGSNGLYQSEEADMSPSSYTEAALLAPTVDTLQPSPNPAIPPGTTAQAIAGTTAQTLAGTTAHILAGTSAQMHADIWLQAWQPLEAGQAAQAQQTHHAQHAQQASISAHVRAKSAGLPVFPFWRYQQSPDAHLRTDKQQQQQQLSPQHASGQCHFPAVLPPPAFAVPFSVVSTMPKLNTLNPTIIQLHCIGYPRWDTRVGFVEAPEIMLPAWYEREAWVSHKLLLCHS